MPSAIDAAALTVQDLLATYEAILAELRERQVVRTNDAPAGQFAEWLAQRVLGGTLALNSVKSYDLTTEDGLRLQVKCRVIRKDGAGARQLSPFRSFDFDRCLVLLFSPSYEVQRAVLLSPGQVENAARWQNHVNGHVLIARDSVLALGEDITPRFAKTLELGL
jgi:hypothetical protein